MARHALLVGINQYANPRFNLRGCLNDIESLARLLADGYGFESGSIEFIRDAAATKATIMSRLETMLSGARSGDTVVFAFSGHGTQAGSAGVEEPDGKDECMVPYEGTYTSLIRDNELYGLFNRYVDEHLKFTAIYDMCHSGTIIRDFELNNVGEIVEGVVNRCLPIESLRGVPLRPAEIGPYNVLSACLDEQTAADLREAGPERLPRGAFSYALHRQLAANRNSPVAIMEPQIAAEISAASSHLQTPSYVLFDINGPLIRY